MAEATPEGSLSLDDAANLLDPEMDNPTDDELEANEVAAAIERDEAEEVEPDDAEEFEVDTANDDDPEPDEDEEPAEYIDVTIDGQTERVTLEEAAKGYQREADYRRKTMALADQRKALEAEAGQAASERAQYAQALAMIQQKLSQSEPEPDWAALKQEDPFEYLTKRDEWREKREQVSMLQSRQNVLAQQHHAEQQVTLEKELDVQRNNLLERIPGWRDTATANKERGSLAEYATSVGFSQEEVDTVIDARAVELLHKAWQFDTLMSKGAEAKRVKRAPPSAKSGQPGSRKSNATRSSGKAFDRLSRTGKLDDAVNFLMSNSRK
jgi:hypothetical protein